jgi:DUF4097 and DUF4098 domain-containing protein YvlB
MTQQTFPVGAAPRVAISQARGDLNVVGAPLAGAQDQQAIIVNIDGRKVEIQQEGDLLTINNCHSDIELEVPAGTSISVANLSGDADISGIRRVELSNVSGDVELEDIAEAVDLEDVSSDLDVTNTPALRIRGHVGSDATLTRVAQVEIETVGSDLTVEDAETVIVGTVGGDLDARDVTAALRCGTIGSDCQLEGGTDKEVTLGMVGGDLEINGAARVQIGTVGGDCELLNVQDTVEVSQVSGDGTFINIGGNLQIGNIGGDAELNDLRGNVEVGSIGGDMELIATFPAGSHAHMNVGGDASVALPDNPNLSIQAAVGGDVSGRSISFDSGGGGNLVNLVYGEGAAQLELNVGGDLVINGSGNPRSSSSSSGSSWGDFGREWADFGREMGKIGEEIGREMGQLGEELGRELGTAFTEAGWSSGADWANKISRKVEEQARRAQHHAEEQARHAQRRAEEQARRAADQARRAEDAGRRPRESGPRAHVRINDREWRLDPERLERIKDQARKAGAEGVTGALEAVERALSNLRIPVPPRPPVPPTPPPPTAGVPTPPTPPAPPTSQGSSTPTPQAFEQTGNPSTGEEKMTEGTEANAMPAEQPGAAESNPEQERVAILRMIAEGRITPEEGDMLLEALG